MPRATDPHPPVLWTTLVAATVVGLVLRTFQLDAQAIWLDEAASALDVTYLANHGLVALADFDHVPPLLTILQAATTSLPLPASVALRLPSVVAGTLAIPAVFASARRVTGSIRAALGAAAFMAVAPLGVWQAQDARMYALLTLFAAVYVWLAWPVVEGPFPPSRAVGLAVVTALGLWTHTYMGLLMIAFGLLLVIRPGLRAGRVWVWALSQAVAAATFVPWLVWSARRAAVGSGTAKGDALLWVPYTAYGYLAGFSLGPSSSDLRTGSLSGLVADWPALALVAVTLLAILVALRGKLHGSAGVWLVLWLCVPVLLAVGITFVTPLAFNVRYTMVAFPAFATLIGLAVADVDRRRLAQVTAVLVATVSVWSLAGWFANPRYAKEDVRGVAGFIAQRATPGTHVLIYSSTAILPLRFYGLSCAHGESLVVDAATVAADVRAAGPGRTLVVRYRPWEADPRGALADALTGAGARVVFSAPGVDVLSLDRLVPLGTGTRTACE